MTEGSVYIHPTAIVEENVIFGKNIQIWHHCHVRQNAHIGDYVSLGKGVFVDKDVSLKEGVRVQNSVNIYKGVNIGEWAFIGPNVTFTNDRYPRAGNRTWKLSETVISPGVAIGAGSIIVSDITLGAFCMIGAGTVVTRDIPPFHLAKGLPARWTHRICACGKTQFDLLDENCDYISPCCLENLNDACLKIAEKAIQNIREKERSNYEKRNCYNPLL